MKQSEYFAELRASGKKGFIPYLLAGFPEKKWTVPLVEAAAKAGAAAIEMGVPFSDPIADGTILQRANFKALQTGINLDEIFRMAKLASKKISIPIFLMGYTNPFLQKGWKRLAETASNAGVSGFIIADLPVEESFPVSKILQSHGLALTLFCSPTTKRDRMKIIEKHCTGFVYLVAAKGVTGPRRNLPDYLSPLLKQVKRIISKPVYVGFGLSQPEQARAVAALADGVILGSRIATFLEENGAGENLDESLHDFLLPWVEATTLAGRSQGKTTAE